MLQSYLLQDQGNWYIDIQICHWLRATPGALVPSDSGLGRQRQNSLLDCEKGLKEVETSRWPLAQVLWSDTAEECGEDTKGIGQRSHVV
jgi:hypothetical protein